MTKSSVWNVVSLLIVGAFWGCTNPFLRQGSVGQKEDGQAKEDASTESLRSSLVKFRNYQVWLPYALNQAGSVVYYVLLANSGLTMAVPICNGLALVFSFLTSNALGERVDKPLQAIAGSTLVMVGVAICIMAQEEE